MTMVDHAPASSPRGCARFSLAEALDRILHRGVALRGEVSIELAEVELLFVDLRLLLGSVDALWPNGRDDPLSVWPQPLPVCAPEAAMLEADVPFPAHDAHAPLPAGRLPDQESKAATSAAEAAPESWSPLRGAGTDVNCRNRDSGEGETSSARGLVRLVLGLVKLLHELLERQAVRRMEAGRLSEAQIERLGAALLAQAEEILVLQRQFGLSDDELALELGVADGAA